MLGQCQHARCAASWRFAGLCARGASAPGPSSYKTTIPCSGEQHLAHTHTHSGQWSAQHNLRAMHAPACLPMACACMQRCRGGSYSLDTMCMWRVQVEACVDDHAIHTRHERHHRHAPLVGRRPRMASGPPTAGQAPASGRTRRTLSNAYALPGRRAPLGPSGVLLLRAYGCCSANALPWRLRQSAPAVGSREPPPLSTPIAASRPVTCGLVLLATPRGCWAKRKTGREKKCRRRRQATCWQCWALEGGLAPACHNNLPASRQAGAGQPRRIVRSCARTHERPAAATRHAVAVTAAAAVTGWPRAGWCSPLVRRQRRP